MVENDDTEDGEKIGTLQAFHGVGTRGLFYFFAEHRDGLGVRLEKSYHLATSTTIRVSDPLAFPFILNPCFAPSSAKDTCRIICKINFATLSSLGKMTMIGNSWTFTALIISGTEGSNS